MEARKKEDEGQGRSVMNQITEVIITCREEIRKVALAISLS